MLTPIGLDHIVLMTTNHEKMRVFYCDILGCSIERRQDKYHLLQLRVGAHLIDLIEDESYQAPEKGNLAHFCIRIEETDFPCLQRDLEGHGLAVLRYGERTNAKGLGPSCYLSDPEGNEVELVLGA